jgi:ion channel
MDELMKKMSLKKIIKNKYSHLLFFLVAIYAITPIIHKLRVIFPVVSLLFVLVIIATLRVLRPKKSIFHVAVGVAIVAFLFEYLLIVNVISTSIEGLTEIVLALYILFIGIALIFLIKNIFLEKSVTSDTIKGGISIYLLMGYWWGLLYSLIAVFNQEAFISVDNISNISDYLFYFSFTTLTTVGYGDIVPKSELAMTTCGLEAIAGQVYLTVFVARLVGIHIVSSYKK